MPAKVRRKNETTKKKSLGREAQGLYWGYSLSQPATGLSRR